MWFLSGILMGSLIVSTHDTEEACRGRMAMLNQVKEIKLLACKEHNSVTQFSGTGSIIGGSPYMQLTPAR